MVVKLNGVFPLRLTKTGVRLKLRSCVTGLPLLEQLVVFEMTDIRVKAIRRGPARLHLMPHAHDAGGRQSRLSKERP